MPGVRPPRFRVAFGLAPWLRDRQEARDAASRPPTQERVHLPMRMPPRLAPLVDDGIIDRVVRPLMSGKEAQVFLVEAGGELRAAKVYKEANSRSFHNRSAYAEGRKVRNSRDQRAMGKRSRHGRERDEAHWKSAEADVIRRLFAAGVRVPKPYAFIDGVLVMECIAGPNGGPAPRLAECAIDRETGRILFDQLIRDVVQMLCADIVHGDLSLFNVLLEDEGAVIIDFPQALNAAQNQNAKRILLRDVANLSSELMKGVPRQKLRHAHEMWDLYERGELMPDTELTGQFRLSRREIDAEELLVQMLEVEEDEAMARVDEFGEPSRSSKPRRRESGGSGNRPRRKKKAPAGPQVVVKGAVPPAGVPAPGAEPPRKKRRRRRRRGGGGGGAGTKS